MCKSPELSVYQSPSFGFAEVVRVPPFTSRDGVLVRVATQPPSSASVPARGSAAAWARTTIAAISSGNGALVPATSGALPALPVSDGAERGAPSCGPSARSASEAEAPSPDKAARSKAPDTAGSRIAARTTDSTRAAARFGLIGMALTFSCRPVRSALPSALPRRAGVSLHVGGRLTPRRPHRRNSSLCKGRRGCHKGLCAHLHLGPANLRVPAPNLHSKRGRLSPGFPTHKKKGARRLPSGRSLYVVKAATRPVPCRCRSRR